MKIKLLNLAIFQIGWIVCLLGGNVWAIAYTSAALLIHQRYVLNKSGEWKLIAIVVLAGSAWEILMLSSGLIFYPGFGPFGVPLWLICLWLLFATTFMHSLAWLDRYLWLAAGLAAVVGPFSYWTGVEISDARFGPSMATSMMVMALGWAVLFPAGLLLARRFK